MKDHPKSYCHAMCPSCYEDVNLKEALNGFTAPSSKFDGHLFYFLCPDCGMKHSKLTPSESESFKQQVIASNTDRLINDDEDSDPLGDIHRWCAVISCSHLKVHNFDPADAFYYGEPFPLPSTFIDIKPSDFSQLMEKKLLLNKNFGKGLEDDNHDLL